MDIKEIIFKAYKDKAVVTKRFKMEIARDYKLSDEDIRNLYIRINNYQVKKYGRRLERESTFDRSKEELAISRRNDNDRKRKRIVRFMSGGGVKDGK